MTPQDRIDTGFAPWSLMTPDPAKARATKPQGQSTAAAVHEDKRAPQMAADNGYMFGEDGFTFGDLLDVVNPLQHLPVIGAVYRSITGDDAAPGAKMAGGAIYGGPVGFASAMINSAIEEHTGDDVMGHMLAMVGLGDDAEGAPSDAVSGGEALARAGTSGQPAAAGQSAATQSAAGPMVAPGIAPIGAEAQLAARAVGTNGALELDPAQAAFLEKLAGRAAGGSDPDSDSEPLDAILNTHQKAAASPATSNQAVGGKSSDFGGVARISGEMAQHLAMLAQAGSPSQALAQQAQQAQAQQAQAARPGGAQSANTADMRSASAKYSAALPRSINGDEPAANPFAALQAKQDEPDPFETAMKRLGLTPPTVSTRGGEDTENKLMQAAFPEQTAAPSQTANLAGMAGITPPPGVGSMVGSGVGSAVGSGAGDGIPSAMMDALNRYQAMKQQG